MRALAAHTVIGIAYLGLVLKFSPVVTGHDEYGLGQLALVLALIVAHIFIGFAPHFIEGTKQKNGLAKRWFG